ncbi:MgtC/SapB transporter [Arthrobacter crystallopoietes BAB-32]|uniref:MgtC/SapB transporter n=1 Tax=Arthrobacter crystallopoietes BAB-32 TaxID=1246476 RepID=N1V3G3_9MICC|nr:MgtC/SapB family protein [Arthrobacter crystallopoietes]EMY34617.1 MgtC/SapB transporter [Arthrobacter crystallopoietes BAB-32]
MLDIELLPESMLTQLAMLVLAFVLSAVVGMERESRLKSAGLRTHTLVGLGSALFTLVSAYGFAHVLGSDVVLDPSRIAAQIVTGIGFLGAGVIFVRQHAVSGLTTAASIWMTAAIGMACGAGMPLIAVAATVLHLATVVMLKTVGRWISPGDKVRDFTVEVRDLEGVLQQVVDCAAELGFDAALSRTRRSRLDGEALLQADLRIQHAAGSLDELVKGLSALEPVMTVTVLSDENT